MDDHDYLIIIMVGLAFLGGYILSTMTGVSPITGATVAVAVPEAVAEPVALAIPQEEKPSTITITLDDEPIVISKTGFRRVVDPPDDIKSEMELAQRRNNASRILAAAHADFKDAQDEIHKEISDDIRKDSLRVLHVAEATFETANFYFDEKYYEKTIYFSKLAQRQIEASIEELQRLRIKQFG